MIQPTASPGMPSFAAGGCLAPSTHLAAPNGDAEHHWGPASGVSVSNKQWRNELLHTLGNLTLLTAKLNDRISNGPFVDANAKTDKKRECEQRTILRVNDFIGERDSWDEAAIVDRGEEQQAATAEILRVNCLSGAVGGTVSSGGAVGGTSESSRYVMPRTGSLCCLLAARRNVPSAPAAALSSRETTTRC